MHTLQIEVRPTQVDSFGHVNNAVYMEYLEWARADWSISRGFSYERFLELGVVPAVVEVKIRFQGEARMGDVLRIETRVKPVHPALTKFQHEILNQHNKRLIRATVSVVAVDVEERTLTEFPESMLGMFKAEELEDGAS